MTTTRKRGRLRPRARRRIREGLLAKVQKIFDELYEIRDAKELAKEGQRHVYASVDEIHGLLEEGDTEISQIQPSSETGSSKTCRKGGPYG